MQVVVFLIFVLDSSKNQIGKILEINYIFLITKSLLFFEFKVRGELEYKLNGRIRDKRGKSLSGLFVEAYDSDVGVDDFLGITQSDSDGQFEIIFDDSSFKGLFERRPDEYLVIKDTSKILHKTQIRSESSNNEYFEIEITKEEPYEDLYGDSLQRILSAFNSVEDTVDMSQVNLNRSIANMIRAITSWSYYTKPRIMNKHGYPGPQVPKYSKTTPHKHTLPWNPKE